MMLNYIDQIYVGKRKTAVCRLKICNKIKEIKVNNTNINKYFYESYQSFIKPIEDLLIKFELENKIKFKCNIYGSGKSAQANSILYALAKAIKAYIIETYISDDLIKKQQLKKLRQTKYLTVDRRKVEPKKYGFRKSRAKEQFVRR